MEVLAMAAATALVSAMATDAWQQARSAVLALWHKVHSERAETIEKELNDDRADVLAGDSKVAEEVTVGWKRQLLRVMRDDPDLEAELRRILDDELTPLLTPARQQDIRNISMTATASGNAKIFQAGDKIEINKGT